MDGAQRSQNRELMDKNRIEGRQGASRWHNTPKASGMPLEVNAAAVRRSSVPLPGEIPPPEGGGKSAEAIVAGGTSRGLEDARSNYETGGLNPTKGRTNEEGINPATDKPADDAGRRGGLESRGGGLTPPVSNTGGKLPRKPKK